MKQMAKLSLLTGILLLLGVTGVYGLPKAYIMYQANTGKVAIHLEEYRMENGMETSWKTAENVLPGGFISKIPRIYNDGADCYVRAKVMFHSKNPSKEPLQQKNLEGISSKWVQRGEYFYYKEVLKSGEKIDFFQGIRIPAEWKEDTETQNQWEATVKAEAVQAECFSPDFSGQDPWMQKSGNFKILKAIPDRPQEQMGDKKEQMELVIAEDTQGFTLDQEGCMKRLETFVPGKSQSGKVVVKNTTNKKREVFFMAEVPEMTPLLEKMQLTVQLKEGTKTQILYQGTITETMLNESQSIGKISPGEEKQIEFLFSLPEEADNAYAAKVGQIKFWFTTEIPEKNRVVTAVQTGDRQPTARYLLIGAIALLAFAVAGKKIGKERVV